MTNAATIVAERMIVEESVRQAAEAVAEAGKQERALFREDGQQIYSDREHQERLSEIRRLAVAQLEGHKEQLGKVLERAQRATLLAHNDPTDELAGPELERAAQAAVFVREAVAELPNAALRERLEAVAAHGKRETQWLYHHYGSLELQRLQEISRSTSAAQDRLDRVGTEARQERTTILAQGLRALADQVLSASTKRTVEEAQALAKQAEEAIRKIDRDLMALRLAKNATGSRGVVDVRAIF